MDVGRVTGGTISRPLAEGHVPAGGADEASPSGLPLDALQIGGAPSPSSGQDMVRLAGVELRRLPVGGNTGIYSVLGLVQPGAEVPPARNGAPVILVHGTRRDKESIHDYLNPYLSEGHPVDFETWPGIQEGERLQDSGQAISRGINLDRVEVARKNVDRLEGFGGDTARIKDFLSMGGDLYGAADPSVGKIAALVPGLTKEIDQVLGLGSSVLQGSFSRRIEGLERTLAGRVAKTGFASDVADPKRRGELCGKVAAEIMDSIVPKAVVLGHSMGGFVSYVMTVNPAPADGRSDPNTYDAAHGVSAVITLSSPVKSGVKRPLPSALTNQAFDMYQKNVLTPLEGTPGMQLAMLNPAFAAWYQLQKDVTRSTWGAMTDTMAVPFAEDIYRKKPGVEQISEGSEFIRKYLDGKKVPTGVTAVAFTNRLDGVSEADRSTVDDRQPNAFNVDVDVDIPPSALKDPKVTTGLAAHYLMASYPFEHREEFRKEILENPDTIPKVLDRANYDGVRFQCVTALLDAVVRDPSFFRHPGMDVALQAVRDVAGERLPFKDSPSYVARQIVDAVEHPGTVRPQAAPTRWVMPGLG